MPSFLRTPLAFFAVASAAAAVPAWLQISARWESVPFGWWRWIALGVCLALLGCGILTARKRGIPTFPDAGFLWRLLPFAAVCSVLCNLYAFVYAYQLPLSILLAMASLSLLWALCRKYSLLVWWGFFMLEMAQIAGHLEYGARINSLVLAETLESSAEEAMAYLTWGNIGICLAILTLGSLLCWALARLMRRQRALPLINTAFLCAAMACLYSAAAPAYRQKGEYYWPVYEMAYLYQSWAEALFHNQETIKQVENLTSPTEQPSSLDTLRGGEGVVLVVHIGESVRADRMSINGYERDTTPWLRSQSRLINFPNCISAACDTCQAQIAILTDARRDIYEKAPEMLPRTGSVLDLFAAHGFKVYSFFGKRNATHLKYDLVVRLLTRCSEERFHAPGSPWTAVPQIADVLRRTGNDQNTLIFINNEGSHTPFFHYDKDNTPFQPACSNFEHPSARAQEVNNAYDSTVHYTDEFVHRVVNQLQGRPWIYLYISDHGEYLGHDGIWGRAGLGESQRNYHSTTGCRVGMFILTSPQLEELHPHFADSLQALQGHTPMLVGQEHIFHTLLGFFALRTPFYNPTLDLTSPRVQPYTGPAPVAE